MRKRFIISKPLSAGSPDEEWSDCLLQLRKIRENGLRPVKFNIFIAGDGSTRPAKDIKSKTADSVISTFGDSAPAFSISVHPPSDHMKVAVEALFAEEDGGVIKTCYSGSLPYVKITSGDEEELWCCGIGNDCPYYRTEEAAEYAFDRLNSILETEGMSMNDIVRQWNYIGNILEHRSGYQNYQLFNEVRHDYYGRYRTIPWYPSATGIGMMSEGVLIDIYALRTGDNCAVIPLDNPNQVKAYNYGQDVLAGQPVKSAIKSSPKFERAILLMREKDSVLLISGTASIIGQVTLGKGDVAEQTRITIENIKKLADPLKITNFGHRNRPCRLTFSNIRVYVKYSKDFDPVRKICQDHFYGVPAVYLQSDICRDDLLAEIEAEVSVSF